LPESGDQNCLLKKNKGKKKMKVKGQTGIRTGENSEAILNIFAYNFKRRTCKSEDYDYMNKVYE
jgi:hypothetical protein